MPFSRRTRTAASMSPFVSCSARLQSIIGAPVWSRSSLTSAAEISAIRAALLGSRLLLRRDFPGGRLLLRRDLLGGRVGLSLGRRSVRRGGRREVGGSRLLLPRGDSVCDRAHDQVAR